MAPIAPGNAVGPSLIDVDERLTAREINDVVRSGSGDG